MEEQTLITGEGFLWGVSNKSRQPGKSLTLFDGETVMLILKLDRDFPDKVYRNKAGEVLEPGLELNMVFTRSLRMQTNGEHIKVWFRHASSPF